MNTVHKAGDPMLLESFRLTFVRAQLGLLQEGILSRRLTPTIRSKLAPVQSGYHRGVQEPQVLLHVLSDEARAKRQRLWVVLADFVKAFLQACRADLLILLARTAGVRGGAFVLLSDMFLLDIVHVWHCGNSCVEIVEGLPEGGTLGPMAYVILPDSLARILESARMGVGVGAPTPMHGSITNGLDSAPLWTHL